MDKLVLVIPKFNPEMYFTQEIIFFILTIVALLFGVVTCLIGYRCFLVVLLVLVGILCGAGGMTLLPQVIQNPVLQMFLFVMFIFVGVILFYMLHVGILKLMTKLKIRRPANIVFSIIAPLLGASIIVITLYYNVYTDLLVDIIVAAVILIIGFVYQFRSRSFAKEFYTYDDLYNRR
jgi:hypothetical protein